MVLFTPKISISENKRYCKHCKWWGPRNSHSRHLKTDHSELYLPNGKLINKTKTADHAMLPSEVPNAVEYEVKIDGFIVKDGKLKCRLLWDLGNKKRTRFQKTIEDVAPFFDNPEFHTAIEKSLKKQYERSGGELAQRIAQTLHNVRSNHQLEK